VAQKISHDTHTYDPDGVLLFLEDLEDIIAIMTKDLNQDVVKLSDNEYVYDSLEDLRKKRGNIIHELHITLEPSLDIQFRFSAYNSSLFSVDAARFLELQNVLKRRVPERRWKHSNLVPTRLQVLGYVVWAGLNVVALVLARRLGQLTSTGELEYILAILAPVVAYVSYIHGRYGGPAYVAYLYYSHERETFWIRNKDKLIFEAVKILGAGIIGWFARIIYEYMK